MTRKRFTKILMSVGISRNTANRMCRYSKMGLSYQRMMDLIYTYFVTADYFV